MADDGEAGDDDEPGPRESAPDADPPDDAGEGNAPDDPGEDGVPDEGGDDDAVEGAEGLPEGVDDGRECPECGESLPADARFCPYCSTAIDEAGDAVDLSELEGDVLPEDPAEMLTEGDAGLRRASGSVRVLAGLAVSVPLAPLVLFLVGSVVPLSVWSGGLVFLGGWFLSAAVLSRSRVPAEAFGYSLYLIAVGTLLVPVAIEVGGRGTWGESLTVSFDIVATASLLIAAVLVVLGTFVTGQARKRVTGERRAFEELRDE